MTDLERVIPLSGIHNFRDYGGYRTYDGRIRRGMLWRSGQHVEATHEDLETIHALDISTIIDLRGDSERMQYPCRRHEEFKGKVLFNPGETAALKGRAVHEEFLDTVITENDAHSAMIGLYGAMPWRPALVETFKLYFRALSDRKGPSLLHCLAGKDRTGIGAALVHILLGVHPDDVMADYLLTNSAGNAEKRIEAGARNLRNGRMSESAIRTLMSVHPAYLDKALREISARHGNVETYLRDVLGVTSDIKDNIISEYVE